MAWPPSDWDPATWGAWTRFAYAVAVLYLVLFFGYFAAFRVVEAEARRGNPAAIARYNRLLRGFPNAFYAKMLGRRPLEPESKGK